MPRLPSRDVIRLLFVTLVVAGVIAAYPYYSPWGSASSRPVGESDAVVAHLQALTARIDRAERQVGRIEQIQNAQERQDQAVTLLRTQLDQTSDWIAATSPQISALVQYTSSREPATRQELDELKQTMSLSQRQISKLRGTVSSDLRRMSNSNNALSARLAHLQKVAEEQRKVSDRQKRAEQRRSRSSKYRRAHSRHRDDADDLL